MIKIRTVQQAFIDGLIIASLMSLFIYHLLVLAL